MVDNSSGLDLFCVWFYKCEIECVHASILRAISSFTQLAAQGLCSEQRGADTGGAQPYDIVPDIVIALLIVFLAAHVRHLKSCPVNF